MKLTAEEALVVFIGGIVAGVALALIDRYFPTVGGAL
jgi:hypothetical protein